MTGGESYIEGLRDGVVLGIAGVLWALIASVVVAVFIAGARAIRRVLGDAARERRGAP